MNDSCVVIIQAHRRAILLLHASVRAVCCVPLIAISQGPPLTAFAVNRPPLTNSPTTVCILGTSHGHRGSQVAGDLRASAPCRHNSIASSLPGNGFDFAFPLLCAVPRLLALSRSSAPVFAKADGVRRTPALSQRGTGRHSHVSAATRLKSPRHKQAARKIESSSVSRWKRNISKANPG